MKPRGVFCLEGDWEDDLRFKTTVEPVLHLLELSHSPSVPHIRRDVGTIGELEHYLSRWHDKRYRDYPILYLGLHGSPGVIYVGEEDDPKGELPIEWLAERLEGKCRRKIVHLGSCGTLDLPTRKLNAFARRLGALAVCGYQAQVHWMQSAAFEIILLSAFQHHAKSRAGMLEVRRQVRAQASGLVKKLRFKMIIAGD